MGRKQQQSDLIYKLGLLLAPLQWILDHPEKYDAASRTKAHAKFAADIFYRYLRDISIGASVTLLTRPKVKGDVEFMDVSKLYAAERCPDNYTLMVHSGFHDRWLCCDNQIYSLGGSIKDASSKDPFTLSEISATQENFSKIEQLLNSGTEIYGPKQPTHP